MGDAITQAMLRWRQDLPHEPSRELLERLAAIHPAERARFLLSAPDLPWVYLPTCPTPEVALAAVDALLDMPPDLPHQERPPIRRVLAELGDVALEALDRRLAEHGDQQVWQDARDFLAAWLARPARILAEHVASRGSRYRELPESLQAAIGSAWDALQRHPDGELHRLYHEPVRAAFGPAPHVLGAEELEILEAEYPERHAELRTLGGCLVCDPGDDPLGFVVRSRFGQLAKLEALDAPAVLIEDARGELANVSKQLHEGAPDRVFAYPHHADRWPGYVREARLHTRDLRRLEPRWHELRPDDDTFERIIDGCERMIAEGDDDHALYDEAAELEDTWDTRTVNDAALHLGHAAFCVLDWVTQRMNRTDQDNLSDILFFTWEAAIESVTSDARREYWETWLLCEVPSAFLL